MALKVPPLPLPFVEVPIRIGNSPPSLLSVLHILALVKGSITCLVATVTRLDAIPPVAFETAAHSRARAVQVLSMPIAPVPLPVSDVHITCRRERRGKAENRQQ